MSEPAPLQLPQLGRSSEVNSARAGNRRGGSNGSDTYARVFPSPISDGSSDAISQLCADGKNSPWLALGISTLWRCIMSHLGGGNQVVSVPAQHHSRVNLQLVPVVSQLPYGANMAAVGNGLRGLDRNRNMDVLPHQTIALMPLSLLIKLIPLAGAAAGVLAFVEGSRTLDIVISILGSSAFIGLVGAVKYFIDRRDKLRSELHKTAQNDASISLEREKLLDTQMVALLKQWEEFYGFREKEMRSVIELQKATIAQRDGTIAQDRELIAQQATTIQQLQTRHK